MFKYVWRVNFLWKYNLLKCSSFCVFCTSSDCGNGQILPPNSSELAAVKKGNWNLFFFLWITNDCFFNKPLLQTQGFISTHKWCMYAPVQFDFRFWNEALVETSFHLQVNYICYENPRKTKKPHNAVICSATFQSRTVSSWEAGSASQQVKGKSSL